MPDLLVVGRIGRAHGVRGDLYVTLTTDRTERLDAGSRLFDGRQWLTVVTSVPQPAGRWRVHFEGVDDRTAAEALTGRTLSAEPIVDTDALWIHELIGSRVVEVSGVERGRCVSVVDNPAHELLELDDGSLVPVVFVVGTAGGVTTIDPPEGLFDLANA